ncbi:MAG TPA: hypothetical protein VL053_07330 [Arachidicoccus sp.]|nr:hypothetical protein [Arachidicoccus sp.]
MKIQMEYFCASKAPLQLLLELKEFIDSIEDEMRLKQQKENANSQETNWGDLPF